MKNFSNYTDYDKKDNLHFESKAVHGALGTEPLTGAVSMPIFQAVTYRHPALGESTGFAYSRLENPTRQELERTMAILEGGIKAFAFSSGQAANMAVFSLLNPGDHVLLSDDIYGGTFRIIGDVFGKYGIEHTYVEMDDLDALNQRIKEQGGEVIGVNTETLDGNADNIATAKKILESAGASFRNIYFDPGSEAGKFALGIMAFPTTYVVDRQGNIVGEPIMGGIDQEANMATLEKLIADAVASDTGK